MALVHAWSTEVALLLDTPEVVKPSHCYLCQGIFSRHTKSQFFSSPGTPVVNALAQQRSCIENILRACLSLPPENSMTLEHKLPRRLFQDKSKSIDSHPQGDKMVSNNHDIIG
jgi:hypothetical protein